MVCPFRAWFFFWGGKTQGVAAGLPWFAPLVRGKEEIRVLVCEGLFEVAKRTKVRCV